MWIFTQTGFLSVVEHRDDRRCLIVRARAQEDLKDIAEFAVQQVMEMPEADYRFRVEVARVTFAAFMRSKISELDYPNFKQRLHEQKRTDVAIEREQFAYQIWRAGEQYQRVVESLHDESRDLGSDLVGVSGEDV
tara:strand:- start:443 stop:847 length:405 start_codon:yes stop_codon:yes gene_type:complete